MRDYHVFSMDSVGGPVTDHGVALDIKDVPWAGRQMWAPDAAEKDGKYYLYFPVKDKQDVFRIGAAVARQRRRVRSRREPEPIEGSYSIDPAVFKDTDGKYYMYFGGIWGGQLQRWATGTLQAGRTSIPPNDQPALSAEGRAAGATTWSSFAETPRTSSILDEERQAAHRRRQRAPLLRSVVDAQVQRQRTTSRTRPATRTSSSTRPATSPYGPFTYRGQDPRAGARLDQPPLDRRVQGQVVSLLPRRAAVGRADAPAQHQGRPS